MVKIKLLFLVFAASAGANYMVDSETRKKILLLWKAGKGYKEISVICRVSLSTIRDVLHGQKDLANKVKALKIENKFLWDKIKRIRKSVDEWDPDCPNDLWQEVGEILEDLK